MKHIIYFGSFYVQGINGRIVFKWIMNRGWYGFIWLRIGSVAGFCEQGNEPWSSISKRRGTSMLTEHVFVTWNINVYIAKLKKNRIKLNFLMSVPLQAVILSCTTSQITTSFCYSFIHNSLLFLQVLL
jgi:hypothetical protein